MFFFFDSRCEYLDKLPPFDPKQPFMRGRRSARHVQQHFYLRKLQGLLCLPAAMACGGLLAFVASRLLGAEKEIDQSYFSFKVLCLHEHNKLNEGLHLLFAKFPELVIDYSKEYCRGVSDWNFVLNTVLNQIIAHSGQLKSQLFTVYEDLLTHLALEMEPEDFLQILPDDGSISFFLPHIQACFHQYKASKLTVELQEDAAREQTEY